jgi:hypothetical protein
MSQRNSAVTISDYNTNPSLEDATEPEMIVDEEVDEYDDETHPEMKLPPGFSILSIHLTNKGGKYALAVLTGINLLNYIDRYVPSATKDLFKVIPIIISKI